MGAWIEIDNAGHSRNAQWVAPHVGAWIEIHAKSAGTAITLSLPMWERGLKWWISARLDGTARRSPCGSVD